MIKYKLNILVLVVMALSLFPWPVEATNSVDNAIELPIYQLQEGSSYFYQPVENLPYPVGEEVIDKRTENSKTTYLGRIGKDDKYAVEVSMGAIHYKDNYADQNEQWKDIDLTWENGTITKAPYILNVNGKNIVMTDKKTHSVVAISLSSVGTEWPNNPTLSFSKGKATASKIAVDTDLEISVENSRVRFTRILKSNKAPLDASFGISKTGDGITVDYQARDSDIKIGKKILVEASIVDGTLHENINQPKSSLTYPVRIDPEMTIGVAASGDDAGLYGNGVTWTWSTVLSYHFAGYVNSANPMCGGGFRFTGVTVPNSATITTANISFVSLAAYNTDTVNTVITGEDVDSAANFSTEADFKARRGTIIGGANNNYITTANVTWDAMAHWTADTRYFSPDIKTIIAEITSRAGWASGNAIVIFWDDFGKRGTQADNAYRNTQTRDYTSTLIEKLYIVYSLPATISTLAATSVEETTAITGGNVTAMGGGNVTSYGTQYGTTGAYGTWCNITSTKTAVFSYYNYLGTNTTALAQGDLYYFRAWAYDNVEGYSYGSQATFITKPNEPSNFVCTTLNGSAIGYTWTKGTGALNTVVIYKDGAYPANIADGTLSYNDTLTSSIQTGLTVGHTYYFRGWSWSAEGGLSVYSDLYDGCFSLAYEAPTVVTLNATLVEEISATTNGNCTATGGTNVLTYGTEYGLTAGLGTWANTSAVQAAPFTWGNALTPLPTGTLYYFRAFATNAYFESFGAQKNFLTKPLPPTAFTAVSFNDTAIDLAWTSATGSGTENTVVRYSTVGYPVDITDGTLVYNGTLLAYQHGGLATGVPVYYSAWTQEFDGGLNQYSDTWVQATAIPDAGTPTVITTSCTGIGRDWGIGNGQITDMGLANVTKVGLDYGLTSGALTGEVTKDLSGISLNKNYPVVMTGLTAGTQYYYKYKAMNAEGWESAPNIMSFSTIGSPSIYEYINTGSDGNSTAFASQIMAQTFTTDVTSPHTVYQLRIPIARVGTPSTVVASIRHASGDLPTGLDLCSGYIDGDGLPTGSSTWALFVMNTETSLQPNTQYAIVVTATYGSATDYVSWDWDAGGSATAGGVASHSVNGGISWVSNAPADHLYEIWGYPSLNIRSANVFKGFSVTGDWLIVAYTDNTLAPYYTENADPSQYTMIELVDSMGTVIASKPCGYWQRQPQSLYLAPSAVTALTWGGTYYVRIADVTGLYYQEYQLMPADWKGTNLIWLDQYIRLMAQDLQSFYGSTYLASTADKGLVLNPTGGIFFTRAITNIAIERPDLFQVYTGGISHTDTTHTRTYELGRTPSTYLGPQVYGLLEDFTNTMGLGSDVKTAATFVFIGVLLFVLIAATGNNFGWGGIALGTFATVGMGVLGLMDLSAIAACGSMLLIFALYQLFGSKG